MLCRYCGRKLFQKKYSFRTRRGEMKTRLSSPKSCSDCGHKSPTYITWKSMLQRVDDPNGIGKKNYRDRGITVCERWRDFGNFLFDMGHRPNGMSLDRINNDGPYEKSNCRWADRTTQRRNSSFLRKITYRGETKILTDWARERGIKVTTLRMRIFTYGWPIEKALGGKNA